MSGSFLEFPLCGEGRDASIMRIFSGKVLNQHEQFTLLYVPPFILFY